MKAHPVAEVRTSRQGRGHAHVDQEGLPVSWPVCLLFLVRWGQLFLGGSRCLGALKTSSHHSFSNFSVLTHAGERGRGRLLTSRRWTRALPRRRNSGEASHSCCTGWEGQHRQQSVCLALGDLGQYPWPGLGFIQVTCSPPMYVLYQKWKLLAVAKDELRSISQLQGKHGFLSLDTLVALYLL